MSSPSTFVALFSRLLFLRLGFFSSFFCFFFFFFDFLLFSRPISLFTSISASKLRISKKELYYFFNKHNEIEKKLSVKTMLKRNRGR